MISKKKLTLMRRRKIAVIASAVLVAILIPTLIFVNYWVKTEPFYDVDGTKYLIKYKDGAYAIYDTNGYKLEVESEYGYYVTALGTLLELNSETGECAIAAVLDTEYTEQFHKNSGKLLIFPQASKENIRSLEVFNSNGSFTFHRYNLMTDSVDNVSEFSVKGAPFSPYNQEKFASLYVAAGYSLSTRKINDPIKDANGEFTEYGLVPEVRIDKDGKEYNYEPAYYILTETSGKQHKMLIGDMLVTGAGYYVQYVNIDESGEHKRDAVYVLDTATKNLLDPIESFMTPTLSYPMTISTYQTIENFKLSQKSDASDSGLESKIGFTYIDIEDRLNTINASHPYVFTSANMSGLTAHTNNIQDLLHGIYQPSYVGVTKLLPTDADLVKYGIGKMVEEEGGKSHMEYDPEYILSFDYNVTNEDESVTRPLTQVIMISAMTEKKTYYTYTMVYEKDGNKSEFSFSYDMIVEVEAHSLDFLTWENNRWIQDTLLSDNIAFINTIRLETNDYWAEFTLDNSKSTGKSTENVDTSKLEVKGKDSKGNDIHAFSTLEFRDPSGNKWTVSSTSLTATTSAGVPLNIPASYFAYNTIDKQVRVHDGWLDMADGRQIKVSADTVEVREADGSTKTYIRYATDLFRRYFTTLVSSTIEGPYSMTEQEEQQLIGDSSKHLLTMKVKDTTNKETVYSFYSLTHRGASRKAYVTINGNGGYYVLAPRITKILNDTDRFFALEPIDHSSKK